MGSEENENICPVSTIQAPKRHKARHPNEHVCYAHILARMVCDARFLVRRKQGRDIATLTHSTSQSHARKGAEAGVGRCRGGKTSLCQQALNEGGRMLRTAPLSERDEGSEWIFYEQRELCYPDAARIRASQKHRRRNVLQGN
jgi:hypothetical protein